MSRSRQILGLVAIPLFFALAPLARAGELAAPPASAATCAGASASRRQLRRVGAASSKTRLAGSTLTRRSDFNVIAFVPTYAYVGLNKIDLASGPDAAELGAAVEAALGDGFQVVIKPHLDPPAYQSGFDQFQSENATQDMLHSSRVRPDPFISGAHAPHISRRRRGDRPGARRLRGAASRRHAAADRRRRPGRAQGRHAGARRRGAARADDARREDRADDPGRQDRAQGRARGPRLLHGLGSVGRQLAPQSERSRRPGRR